MLNMKKIRVIKKNTGISPERMTELQRATLMASTGASLRLAGSKVTNEKVEQILNTISKPSVQK